MSSVKRSATAKKPPRSTSTEAPRSQWPTRPATTDEQRALIVLALERVIGDLRLEVSHVRNCFRQPGTPGSFDDWRESGLETSNKMLEQISKLDDMTKALVPEGGWSDDDKRREPVMNLAWKGIMSRLGYISQTLHMGASQDARFAFMSAHLGTVLNVFELYEQGKTHARTSLFMGPVGDDGSHSVFVTITPQPVVDYRGKAKGKAR